jgi:hypothetical protein
MQVNVKLSLYLIKPRSLKTYGGVKVFLHIFLMSGLMEVKGKLAAGTHWIRA